MAHSNVDHAIRTFRTRVGLWLFIREAAAWATVACIAWGLAVLILRTVFYVDRTPLAWGLLALVPALVVSGVLAWRRRPAESRVRALLDRMSGCGGLLVASGEADLGDWARRLPELEAPFIRWHNPRRLVPAGVAALFLAVAFLVPRPEPPQPKRRLNVDSEVAELGSQVEVLREEEMLPPEEAKELEERLRNVKREASGSDPVKTLEALARIDEKLRGKAREEAEKAIRQSEALQRVENLARTIDAERNQLDPKSLSAAMKALSKMTRDACKKSKAFGEAARKAGATTGDSGKTKLSPEMLDKLAKACKACQGGAMKKMGKLTKARLVSKEVLEKLAKSGQCKGGQGKSGKDGQEGLAKFLAENAGKGLTGEELVSLWLSGQWGRGGITRGPGDAPMTWKDPSSSEGAAFEEKVLQPGAMPDPEDTAVVGLGEADPTEEDLAPSSGGALGGASGGGGSAERATVLPRHRRAVRDYFHRNTRGGSGNAETP